MTYHVEPPVVFVRKWRGWTAPTPWHRGRLWLDGIWTTECGVYSEGQKESRTTKPRESLMCKRCFR